jgi:hypothetical protein
MRRNRLWWYGVALVPIMLLILAPLEGWVAGEVIVLGGFLLLFWLFSLAFAIYATMRKPRTPRP